MLWGKVVSAPTSPPKLPPTATFIRIKNGWLNTHCLPCRNASLGVAEKYGMPSIVQMIGIAVTLSTGVARTMEGAEYLVGQAAHMFHDIDLAGLRPIDLVNIGAKHPE